VTRAELEEDSLNSYLLAVVTIGEQVRAGLRELPASFVPTRRNPGDARSKNQGPHQVDP
jgi:hypothetical protein